MAWFVGQSVLILLVAALVGLVIGLLVGWILWHRAAVTERPAGASVQVSEAGRVELDARDSQIARLRTELAARTSELEECRSTATQPVTTSEPVTTPEPATTPEPIVTPRPVATVPEPPTAPVATADEVADDEITRIEGIGPKIASVLRAAGLRTFRAIAAATEEQLRDAVTAGGVRFTPSLSTWSRQAALLAAGDEAGFAALKARLTAGRDKG